MTESAGTISETTASLKQNTITAVFWSVVRVGWGNVASLAIFVVLARLLNPSDLGIFALASVLMDMARIVAGAGLNDAIIRQSKPDDEFADTAFWAMLGLGVVMALVAFAAAPLYGWWIQQEAVVSIIGWLAVLLPLSALASVHTALLTREFGHRALAGQAVLVSCVSGIAAVAAALYGFGVWSLVVQSAIGSVLGVVLAWWAYRWRPRLRFSWRKLAQNLSFSVSMILTQLLWLMLARIQDIFISQWYGADAVGRYRVAWRLIELVAQSVLAPIGGVSLVTFSRLQDDPERFSRAYNRIVGLAALSVLPMLFGFGALANEIISVVFGPRWASVGDIATVLVLMAVPFVNNFFTGPALAAVNRAPAILMISAVQFTATLVLTWLLIPYGVIAVAAAYVLRAYLTMPLQISALRRYGGIRPRDTLNAILPPLLASLAMAVTVFLTKAEIGLWVGEGWPQVASCVALGAAIYVVIILVAGRGMIRPLIDLASPFMVRGKQSA